MLSNNFVFSTYISMKSFFYLFEKMKISCLSLDKKGIYLLQHKFHLASPGNKGG